MAKDWPAQVLASRPDNAADLPPGCGKPNINHQGSMTEIKD